MNRKFTAYDVVVQDFSKYFNNNGLSHQLNLKLDKSVLIQIDELKVNKEDLQKTNQLIQ